MNDEITRMNTGFENQTTLDALIGTGVTDGSAYATLAAYGAVPGTGEEPEKRPSLDATQGRENAAGLLARKSGLANDYGTYLTALSVAATQYSERTNLNDQVCSYHHGRIVAFLKPLMYNCGSLGRGAIRAESVLSFNAQFA